MANNFHVENKCAIHSEDGYPFDTAGTMLDLSHNQLSELPPEIGQLSNLRTLRVGHKQLTALPPEIRKLSELTIYGWNE